MNEEIEAPRGGGRYPEAVSSLPGCSSSLALGEGGGGRDREREGGGVFCQKEAETLTEKEEIRLFGVVLRVTVGNIDRRKKQISVD